MLSQTIATSLGRKLLHTWHLRPLLNIQQIEQRHDAVDMLTYPDQQHDAERMRKTMKSVGNVITFSRSILRGKGKLSDWRRLLEVSRPSQRC